MIADGKLKINDYFFINLVILNEMIWLKYHFFIVYKFSLLHVV